MESDFGADFTYMMSRYLYAVTEISRALTFPHFQRLELGLVSSSGIHLEMHIMTSLMSAFEIYAAIDTDVSKYEIPY